MEYLVLLAAAMLTGTIFFAAGFSKKLKVLMLTMATAALLFSCDNAAPESSLPFSTPILRQISEAALATTEVTILEAEDAELGPNLSIKDVSGVDTPCVGSFKNSTDYIDFSFNALIEGDYIIQFKTDRENWHEIQYQINADTALKLNVPDGTGMRYSDSATVTLNQGLNTIRFYGYWGWLNIDHMTVQFDGELPVDYSEKILEAEDAELGPNLSIKDVSGVDTPCVGSFTDSTDYIDFSYNAPLEGEYIIRFKLNRTGYFQVKYQINSEDAKTLDVLDGTEIRYSESAIVTLNQGQNTIRFIGFWGYLSIDHMTIQYDGNSEPDPDPEPIPTPEPDPVADPDYPYYSEYIMLEAENAQIGPNLSITEVPGVDTPCVGTFPNAGNYIDFSYTPEKCGEYVVRFKTDKSGPHTVKYLLNGTDSRYSRELGVPDGTGMRYSDSVTLVLKEGENNIRFYGYSKDMNIDRMLIFYDNHYPHYDYSTITPDLVNANANDETKALYTYLRSNYGKKIISGYTGVSSKNRFDDITAITGTSSKIYAIDFNTLTPGFPYNWSNALSTQIFGALNNGQVEAAIARHNAGHIITAQWHWYAPSGGHGTQLEGARGERAGTRTLDPTTTQYDIRLAVDPTTEEYSWLIQDIDIIAEALKELQDAGVPVLWRPLHEAAGGWFWWGTDKEAFVELWDIMYDRLTNYHKLNNLIWVLSQAYPEKGWLVDHNRYDIIGFDNYPSMDYYPGELQFIPQGKRIRLLREQGQNEKMVALTETGPFPYPARSLEDDALYSYFLGWGNVSIDDLNTSEHIWEVYNSDLVITNE